MPVTYALLTPLALFTLDTSNWETRNHEEPVEKEAPEGIATGVEVAAAIPEAMLELVSEPVMIAEAITATGRLRRAQSAAQLPAA